MTCPVILGRSIRRTGGRWQSLVSAAFAVLVFARAAAGTTVDDLCPAGIDPCTITASHPITPGSSLDFGDRAVILKAGKNLDVGADVMLIKARSLLLEPNARLLGAAGFVNVTTTGAIELQASGSTVSKINVSDVDGGGSIDLEAGGAVTLAGTLTAKSNDTQSDGGDIFVQAGGDVLVTAAMNAKGGSDAGGGNVTIFSGGTITVTQPIDVSAGEFDGGEVDLEAQGDVTLQANADIDISGGSLSGFGGSVELDSAVGDITMNGTITGTAGGSVEEGGGGGGAVQMTATQGAIGLLADVDVFGADGGGGGDGGDVTLTAGGPLTIGANIDAHGGKDTTTQGYGDGNGGNVTLQGCDVTLTAGHTVDATVGAFGRIDLRAGGHLVVAGTLVSSQANLLEYRDPAQPPTVTGSVTPAAQVLQSCTVPACFGACGNHALDACEQCDDGNTSAGDCCSPTCTADPDGGSCDDGNACTGGETCSAGACVGSAVVDGSPCDDGNGCTDDGCVSGACLGTAAPASGCKQPIQPLASLLQFKDKTPDSSDSFGWKFTKGDATTPAELGDPLTSDDYTFCVYGSGPTLLFAARVPAGGTCVGVPCWKVTSTGYGYKDKDRTPDGVGKLGVSSGGAGATKAKAKGKGTLLSVPTLGALPLPLTAQLRGPGACFEATYSTPITNTTEQFKAKSD